MGSRAGLDEYGEEKISPLAPSEFEPRTATPTILRVLQTMSCVFLPHSIKFSNCRLWVLQIRNLERNLAHSGSSPILWRRYSWRLPFCLNSQYWQRTRILAACFPARLLVPQGLLAPLTEFRCVLSTQNTSRSRNHICSNKVPHFTSISRKTASQFRDLCNTEGFPNSYSTSNTNTRATILSSVFIFRNL